MDRLSTVLSKVLNLTGMSDLFYVIGRSRHLKDLELCSRQLPEGLVVDVLAYYNPSTKTITLCENLIEKFARIYKVDKIGCYETLLSHILLHEHVHYITDVLGLLKQFSSISDSVRPDEPFCEYIALKSLATGVYRVFGYEKRLGDISNTQTCVPFIATFYRPYPYSAYRELYAVPDMAFVIKPEEVLLSLIQRVSKFKQLLKVKVADPEPGSLERISLLNKLHGTTRVSITGLPTIAKIAPVKVAIA